MRPSHLMREGRHTPEYERGAWGAGRRCAVRLSILGWEVLLVVMVLAGAAGYLVVRDADGDHGHPAGRPTLGGNDGPLEAVPFAPGVRTLLSCGWDKQVRLWDLGVDPPGGGREIDSLYQGSHLFSIAITA